MNDSLKLKPIIELLGMNFQIPSYQRGYRWTEKQVNDLLNDIWRFVDDGRRSRNAQEYYCLQPIVVKKIDSDKDDMHTYEVIDGQQRITTIFLILKYLAKTHLRVESLAEEYKNDLFTIKYDTRSGSENYLQKITEDESVENIDYYYIYSAYNTITKWFTSGEYAVDRTDRNSFLDALLGKKSKDRSVQVIWYEVDKNAEGVDIFTRLNIGKIPLTNSELVKALFLSNSSFADLDPIEAWRKKVQISQIWDDIEQHLCDEDFWAFLTNRKQSDYVTKIEMLLDTISEKKISKSDPYHTFLHFFNLAENSKVKTWDAWLMIEKYYLTLREWYKNKNLYHKVGFLINAGADLGKLVRLSLDHNKAAFEMVLDSKIREQVKVNLRELSYENQADHKHIKNILLLFNVESIRNNDKTNEYYPFKFHKNIDWSIEHIHAQNTEGLDRNKKEPWKNWLDEHQRLLEEMASDHTAKFIDPGWKQVLDELRSADREKLTWEVFASLSERVVKLFTEKVDGEQNNLHSLSNLTLLGHADNAALSNSVFEVKRRLVVKLDIDGHYIPVCTRRVFLKYYNDNPSGSQNYYWGKEDQINYMSKIIDTIRHYLPDESELEQDEDEFIAVT